MSKERSQDEYDQLFMMTFEWSKKGHPEKANRLAKLLAAGEEIPVDLIVGSAVKKESAKGDLAKLIPPPRSGAGSGKDEWVDFAFEVTDMEEEVLEGMTRTDIVTHLENVGIIEKED